MVACVKLSNELPKFGNKYELYASYPGFLELMQSEKSRLVDMLVLFSYSRTMRLRAAENLALKLTPLVPHCKEDFYILGQLQANSLLTVI